MNDLVYITDIIRKEKDHKKLDHVYAKAQNMQDSHISCSKQFPHLRLKTLKLKSVNVAEDIFNIMLDAFLITVFAYSKIQKAKINKIKYPCKFTKLPECSKTHGNFVSKEYRRLITCLQV